MDLNEKQKQFLFDNNYITSKMLDSLTYDGWQKFWIKNFNWELDLMMNKWNMRTIHLIDKSDTSYAHEYYLNFQGNDLNKLKKLGEEKC